MKVVALGSHSGTSMNSGHWTAAHRVRQYNENPNAKPKWLRFNDRKVSPETFRNTKSSAYEQWKREATVVAYATVPGSSGRKGKCNNNKDTKKNGSGSRKW